VPPSAADRDQLNRAKTPSTHRHPLPNSRGTPLRQKTAASRHEFKDAGTWAREEVNRAGRNHDHAPQGKKFASGSTLGKCQVNYAKPLEMAYF